MKKSLKILITLILLINIFYMLVRFISIPIFQGIPSFLLGISLFTAELLGFFAFITYIYIFTGIRKIKRKTLSDLHGNIPTVDVFICTYNEDKNILSKTILAAQNLNYPKDKYKIYVLDDGNRSELKKLCDNFYHVNYISREKNINAKAGNINNALKQTDGEFFTVLDADMICKPDFLYETIGYFSDENLAFVQTPQTYYNADIYQYNISNRFNNEQDFFMRYIESARDSRECVLHIGTNAVFRRKYVEHVGLYPTNSITEDMALGLLLQANGYDSIFINKTLVCGLSATTYPDLIKQRDRWCRGNLQVLHNYKKIIFKKLKTRQKVIYIDGVLYWFSGLTKLIFILTPIIYLLTGFTIVNIPPKYLFPLFLIAFSGQILLSKCILPKEISSKYFSFFMKGEFYNTIMAPHLSSSIFKHYFFSDLKFNVTQKNMATHKGHYYIRLALPHFILLILCIISLVIGTLHLGKSLYLDSYLINIFWVLYNIPGLIIALKIAYQPARNLNMETIPLQKEVNSVLYIDNVGYNCLISEISESYACVKICNDELYNDCTFEKLTDMVDFNIDKLISENSNLKLKIDNSKIACKPIYFKQNYIFIELYDMSYSDLNNVMNLFLHNLQPYKYNRFF